MAPPSAVEDRYTMQMVATGCPGPAAPLQPAQTEPAGHPSKALELQIPRANSIVGDMVHDSILSTATGNRRATDRETGTGELVIDWHALPDAPGRYDLVNESDGGCLISSAVPLIEGMTGRVRTRLPEGQPGRVSVIVAWVRRVDSTYHIGLRYFAFC